MTSRAPPGHVLQRMVAGPTLVSHALWFDRIDSTNAEVARRAADGADEGLLVLADEQTAGRGRLGRAWHAPPGTSLMGSLLLRPASPATRLPQLPLLVGLTLAEACEPLVSGAQLSLKWPNDLLADGRKCAGILVESVRPDAVVVGLGLNVDWRAVDRPDDLTAATSLSEVGRGPVDRWQLLTGLVDRLGRRYRAWCDRTEDFLPAYRERCATLGAAVRVHRVEAPPLIGTAERITDAGALIVSTGDATVEVRAGDVHHLRTP
jgi:BirA family biotin operon repressor/biotin-[acetyl-CoA-carboxylase] ligase